MKRSEVLLDIALRAYDANRMQVGHVRALRIQEMALEAALRAEQAEQADNPYTQK